MKKKTVKCILLVAVVIFVFILILSIYNNLFAGGESLRYKDINKHKLTNNEINSVKDKVNELDNIKDIDVYIDSKIIKIVIKLEEDINFEDIQNKANEVISSFSEKNIKYYDIEFFVDSLNKKSEIYPQIGYKFKTNETFSW